MHPICLSLAYKVMIGPNLLKFACNRSNFLQIREKRAFWATLKHIINPDLDVSIRTLWKYGNGDAIHATVDKWQVFDDKVLGGASQIEVETVLGDGGHLVIKGSLDFDEDRAEEMNVRGGYCAVRGSCSEVADLRDYQGLKIVLRSPMKELAFTVFVPLFS